MKIERVEDMLDDIREQGDQLTQIQDAMKQPLGYAPDVDESELEAELEVLPSLCGSQRDHRAALLSIAVAPHAQS